MSFQNHVSIESDILVGSLVQLLCLLGYELENQVWTNVVTGPEITYSLEDIRKIESVHLKRQVRFKKLLRTLLKAGYIIQCEDEELDVLFYYDPIIAILNSSGSKITIDVQELMMTSGGSK